MAEDLSEHPLRDRGRPSGHEGLDLWGPVVLAVVGAVLLFAGYWGASDSTTPGEQLPHLASGTIPGAALVIAAAVLLHRREAIRARQEAAGVAARLDALVDWLVTGSADQPAANGTVRTAEPAQQQR